MLNMGCSASPPISYLSPAVEKGKCGSLDTASVEIRWSHGGKDGPPKTKPQVDVDGCYANKISAVLWRRFLMEPIVHPFKKFHYA